MKKDEPNISANKYLQCEKRWVYHLLMFIGGYLGAYTMILRGGVFCNAQTGNVVLMGIALGEGRFSQATYYLIPISAYFLGSLISELSQSRIKRLGLIRWETTLLSIQVVVTLILGLLPDLAPVQITQIAINFICAMQYNTFRQSEGLPMATTFCTNHIRQLAIFLSKWIDKKDASSLYKATQHLSMLFSFMIGVAISAFLCHSIGGKTIWGATVLYALLFIVFLRADRTKEKHLLDKTPSGH